MQHYSTLSNMSDRFGESRKRGQPMSRLDVYQRQQELKRLFPVPTWSADDADLVERPIASPAQPYRRSLTTKFRTSLSSALIAIGERVRPDLNMAGQGR